MFVRNLNWGFVGLQALVIFVFVNLGHKFILMKTSDHDLFVSFCQNFLAFLAILSLRKSLNGEFKSLEIFLGSCFGLLFVYQKFEFVTIGIALFAICLLEANEVHSENVEKQDLWMSTACLLVCYGLVLSLFGLSSEKWILSALIGWVFQVACLLSKNLHWTSTPSGGLWYPIKKYRPYLWIVFFVFANFGLLALIILNGSFNLALILVLGKIIQPDRSGRWVSTTRLLAVFLIILPELLQNVLQLLLQY